MVGTGARLGSPYWSGIVIGRVKAWLSQLEGIGEVMYAWIAGHGSWVECYIGMSGSNSVSDQILELSLTLSV